LKLFKSCNYHAQNRDFWFASLIRDESSSKLRGCAQKGELRVFENCHFTRRITPKRVTS